jgi:hypothetical protein
MLFSKNLYEEITAPKKSWFRQLLPPLLWCVVPGLLLVLFLVGQSNSGVMNFWVNHITTPLKQGLSKVLIHLPFALAEVIWTAAVIAVVVFVVRTIYLLITRENRLLRFFRRLLAAVSAGLIVYCCYTLMWGINYYSDSFSQQSGITARGCATEELYQLTAAFGQRCNELSGEVVRNAQGEVELDVSTVLNAAGEQYQQTFEEFPFLERTVYHPKAMIYSRIISYMGFTGFYFPMTAESLVNVDQPDFMIPATALHELAHQCNVAAEDEANFVAILTGLHCEDSTYQYSSAMMGYIYLSNALYSADKDSYSAVAATLNDQVKSDLTENNSYWAQFKTPVENVSKKIYTGFLQSYGQSEGMKSYGKCVDLLVAYYFDYRQ